MPSLENTSARVILKPGRDKSLKNRHPWVFSGGIAAIEGEFAPGDILPVFAAKGNLLGKGFVNPASQIRVRMLTIGGETVDAGLLERRLGQAQALREQFLPPDTDAYRLVHGEADLLPGLIIDRYGDNWVVQFHALGMARLKPQIVDILKKTLNLMTSEQMAAFKVATEPEPVKERYGNTNFGRGCLMARRLVEAGVPFIEVDLGGWDNHQNIHTTLADTKLPELDQAMSALVEDLEQRGLLQDTAIIWMGEFSRTPRINGNAGRDHWARAWSVVVGGGGMNGGIAVGETNSEGTRVETEPYTSQDVMASVCKALGISLETTFTSKSGRPMKIANSGKVIRELFA